MADGGELLLVIPASAACVLRVFAITGIDRLIPHVADLNQALERAPAVVPRPLHRRATPGMRTRTDRLPHGPAALPGLY